MENKDEIIISTWDESRNGEICKFIIQKKKRQCKFSVLKGHHYCVAHIPKDELVK
jgi:hypothetical protein